jgi:hypothetical protein
MYDKSFGQDIFIVGGGYSVREVNLDFLTDRVTIAINDSYKILPNATALFWCDNSWCGREMDGLQKHECELRFHPRTYAETHIKKDITGPAGSTILNRTGEYGYDPNIDNVMGNNGGTQALNFAVNLGAKRVYLIGFDMRDDPLSRGTTHWHDAHQVVIRHDTYSRLFIPSIEALNKELKKRRIGTEVINCSRTSAITCFKKKNVKGLMK